MKTFIPYAKQSITEGDLREVNEALKQDLITRGPLVASFERAVADYCEAKYAVAFNSGTTALFAACYAAKINQNDRCLTTPNSFIATSGALMARNATPVFVDIDPTTGNMDLELLGYNLEQKSLKGRNVILPVHFSGIPVDMEKIDNSLRDPNVVIIEDAAHAFGSTYRCGKKVGSCEWSQMTIFSFHPTKQLTAGEGGIVTTNDEELYHRLQLYRNNGIEREAPYLEGESTPWGYEVVDVTGNFNFTEFQAALGLSQLKRIDEIVKKRRSLMKTYRKLLKGMSKVRLFTDEYDDHVSFHICVAQIDFAACKKTRTQVMNNLKERGIGTQVHYIPLYRHPCIKKTAGDISEYFPKMEAYYAQALSLPLYYDLSTEDVAFVVQQLKEVLR